MNFATLKSLTIPEGVVKQIADSSGRVLWSASKSRSVVLQVKKVVASTNYVNGTEYTNEEFLGVNVTPKIGGTVEVSYGGVTKTYTDSGEFEVAISSSIFFGTFGGVSDSTPASGTLTISGDLDGFGVGRYSVSKSFSVASCDCVTDIIDWGEVITIPESAFAGCLNLPTNITIPSSVTSIKALAFQGCSYLENVIIPSSVTNIYDSAFNVSAAGTKTIRMLSATPPTIVSGCFNGIDIIVVPAGASNIYKSAAGWSDYASIITEAS